MNKKIFLTSAAIMCMACPAIAESFPSDGNMVENETYANAAVYDNTGVYEGTATANAYYTTNNYNVSAGSYFTGLDANNDATTATCTSGNYCPGVVSTTYDDVNSAFVDDGLKACPANYSGSAAGATANTDCYRACSTTDVAKSATVSGQMYYDGTSSDGVNACVPETCVSGWHIKQAAPNLVTLIGDTKGTGEGYVTLTGKVSNINLYGFTNGDLGKYGTNYNNIGRIKGTSQCSTRGVTNPGSEQNEWAVESDHFVENLPDNTGRYCYCRVDKYLSLTNAGGWVNAQSSFVFFEDYGSAQFCADLCTQNCADKILNGYGGKRGYTYRNAVFGSVEPKLAICEANTINITWNDASAEDIAATGAATTVYEGDIKTPLKAVTKPGKTFVGWKFIKPTNPAPVQGEGD